MNLPNFYLFRIQAMNWNCCLVSLKVTVQSALTELAVWEGGGGDGVQGAMLDCIGSAWRDGSTASSVKSADMVLRLLSSNSVCDLNSDRFHFSQFYQLTFYYHVFIVLYYFASIFITIIQAYLCILLITIAQRILSADPLCHAHQSSSWIASHIHHTGVMSVVRSRICPLLLKLGSVH